MPGTIASVVEDMSVYKMQYVEIYCDPFMDHMTEKLSLV